jgi:recombination associated protein RdgC
MLPTQLALSWDGRVSFNLTELLQLKKVKFLDGDPDAALPETAEERFDADIALATGMLAPLLDALIEVLGGELQT